MTNPEAKLTPPAAELLVTALTSGDTRMAAAFQRTLDRTAWRHNSGRNEGVEALKGLLGAFVNAGTADSHKVLEPTLRHLLARVL